MKIIANIIVTIWFLQMVATVASNNDWNASPWWILVPFGLMIIWGRWLTLVFGICTAFLIWLLTYGEYGDTKIIQAPTGPPASQTSR